MVSNALAAIIPLALGHDQEAFACPWVRLTGRTAEYPSRKAQAALAVANGALPITPDLVNLLYRCDDCGRCRAASVLPGPPDPPRALWEIRASFVDAGAVPEVARLAETHARYGNLYGDVREAAARLATNEGRADTLFVPGAATLYFTPEVAVVALASIQAVEGSAAVHPDNLDSGHTMRELGLAEQANEARNFLRQHIEDTGYRMVVAGTPKEAFGLHEALEGLAVDIRYAGNVVAHSALERRAALQSGRFQGALVLHPSETLLHRIDGFAEIDGWLRSWLGDRYLPEPDPPHDAWPAAVERPVVGTLAPLTRALAEQRLAQLRSLAGEENFVILTCDPFSWRALREIAPPTIDVVDLLVFAARYAEEDIRVP
jgi:hypothetical protein